MLVHSHRVFVPDMLFQSSLGFVRKEGIPYRAPLVTESWRRYIYQKDAEQNDILWNSLQINTSRAVAKH